MSYLIDTNIIAEVRKGDRCNPDVARWWARVADAELFLSVLVLAEIRNGIELARPRDPAKAATLGRWLDAVSNASRAAHPPHRPGGGRCVGTAERFPPFTDRR